MTQEIQVPSEYVHPGELAAFPANSNTHSPQNIEELVESWRTFGQYKNIVVWSPKEKMTITVKGKGVTLLPSLRYVIAGEGLWRASKKRQEAGIKIEDHSHHSYEKAVALAENDNASPLGSRIDPGQLLANLDRARSELEDNPRLAAMMKRAREAAGAVDYIVPTNGQPPEVRKPESECLVEILCSNNDLLIFSDILNEWGDMGGVTINIS